MAHANFTTRYICGYAACPGVMNATVTMAGERCYECCHCGHTAMAHLVEQDNERAPAAYGRQITALMAESNCTATIAALAVLDAHRMKEAA